MRVSLEQAAQILSSGGVVAVPTETVYGLAASLSDPAAIQHIFTLKGRPSDNPLITHLASGELVKEYAKELPPHFTEIVDRFWPGPLTIVLKVDDKKIPANVRAGLPTAAFRVPNHPLAKALLEITGPLVMPSANLSGRPSSTKREHVENDFGREFPVLDGGECVAGVESTILIYTEQEWKVIRLGSIPPSSFTDVLGYEPSVPQLNHKTPLCPGQMYRHYSPHCRLHLVKVIPAEYTGAVVGFEDRVYPNEVRLYSLGISTDPYQAAHRLYDVLRHLDQVSEQQAFVDIDFPKIGLWFTLLERLDKAKSGI